MGILFRLRRGMEQYGPVGLVRQGSKRLFVQDDEFVWYLLDLARVDQLPLAEGYELHQAEQRDVELIRELPSIPEAEAQQRFADGIQMWFVLQDRDPAFVCFIFPPGFGIEGDDGMELPDRVACLENSFTNPNHRGKGIAPAAWTAIAARLKEQGCDVLITKVGVENAPSRKAVEKAGFLGASVMHHRRRALKSRVIFRDEGAELTEDEREIGAVLERGLAR